MNIDIPCFDLLCFADVAFFVFFFLQVKGLWQRSAEQGLSDQAQLPDAQQAKG